MAYTPKLFEDGNKKQGAPGGDFFPSMSPPTMPGPRPAGAPGAGPATPQAPQAPAIQAPATTALGPGTGFVNIDRVLGANQGAGEDITRAANKSLSNDKNRFGIAERDTLRAQDAGDPSLGVQEATNRFLGGTASSGDLNTIKRGLSGVFNAPTSVNYQIGANADIAGARALANAQSAGRELASRGGNLATYNPMMSSIDAAIYGMTPGVKQAVEGVGRDIKAQLDDQTRRGGAIAQRGEDIKRRAGETSASLRGQLTSAARAIAADAGAQARANSGQGVTLTPENFVTADQANTMRWIAEALGDPSLAITSRPRDLAAEAQTRFENASSVAAQNVMRPPGGATTDTPPHGVTPEMWGTVFTPNTSLIAGNVQRMRDKEAEDEAWWNQQMSQWGSNIR